VKIELKVQIINPSTCSKITRCKCCGIDYDKEGYLLFFKMKKIVYFLLSLADHSKIKICDDCLISLGSLICLKNNYNDVTIHVKSDNETKTIQIPPIADIDLTTKLKNIYNKVQVTN